MSPLTIAICMLGLAFVFVNECNISKKMNDTFAPCKYVHFRDEHKELLLGFCLGSMTFCCIIVAFRVCCGHNRREKED